MCSHFLLALASALSCLAYGFYLVVSSFGPSPCCATGAGDDARPVPSDLRPCARESNRTRRAGVHVDANGEPKLSLELGAMRAGGGGGHGTDAGDTSCGFADDAEEDVI
jgi:hypothetical protein